MTKLILGLVLFLGMHSVSIVARDARHRWMQRLGEGPWKGLYSVVSAVGLVLIVLGYAEARMHPVVLYTPPTGLRHVALLLLLPVFVLLVSVYLRGHIKRVARHPMLLATKLWAVAHLLSNGTLADVLLFGGFLAWAVADRISVKRRGDVAPSYTPKPLHDAIALVLGLAIYAWFAVQGHAWLIGVSPIGR